MRATVCLLFLAAVASADSKIERTATWVTERPGARAEKTNRRETLWVGDGKVRADDRVSKESWIVRADRKVIWRIDHALKTYTEISFEDAAKQRAVVAADLKAAIARVAGTGDEAALRKFLDAFAPAAEGGDLKDAGDGGAVAGKPTHNVSLEPEGAPGVTGRLAADASGLDRLARTLGDAGLLAPGVATSLAKSKGMLLSGAWTLAFPDAIVRETFEVTKVEEAAAPEGAYDVPAGYRKLAAKPLRRDPTAASAPQGGYDGDPPGTEGTGDEPSGEEAGKDE